MRVKFKHKREPIKITVTKAEVMKEVWRAIKYFFIGVLIMCLLLIAAGIGVQVLLDKYPASTTEPTTENTMLIPEDYLIDLEDNGENDE